MAKYMIAGIDTPAELRLDFRTKQAVVEALEGRYDKWKYNVVEITAGRPHEWPRHRADRFYSQNKR
jgi:hypothetical protein